MGEVGATWYPLYSILALIDREWFINQYHQRSKFTLEPYFSFMGVYGALGASGRVVDGAPGQMARRGVERASGVWHCLGGASPLRLGNGGLHADRCVLAGEPSVDR